MTSGLISSIQGYSTKDGPGIRTTVFLVGCNLRCQWCSNPELMIPGEKEMTFETSGVIHREHVGTWIESEALAETLARDRIFYEESGGGVTFSGGEPALQKEFVKHTAKYLNSTGINCALDTAGDVPYEVLDELSEEMDLMLYDIKAYDEAIHKTCTGCSNRRILENAERLAKKRQKLMIRMVVVPGYNDDLEDMRKRLEFVHGLGNCVIRTDILPYHTLGEGKYRRMGIPYPISSRPLIEESYWMALNALANEIGVSIQIER